MQVELGHQKSVVTNNMAELVENIIIEAINQVELIKVHPEHESTCKKRPLDVSEENTKRRKNSVNNNKFSLCYK